MRKLIFTAALALASTAAQAGYFDQPRLASPEEMRQRQMQWQVEENNAILRRQERRERGREMNYRQEER
mgnify:CR=1 FL=1